MGGKRSCWLACAWAFNSFALAQGTNAGPLEFFETKIRPVLAANCNGCHNPKMRAGGLDLSSAEAFQKGGATGPVFDAANPENSKLLRALDYSGTIKMPPMGKLKEPEIADIRAWLKMGAPWPSVAANPGAKSSAFWAFQPVIDYPAPAIRNAAWVKDPIDRFILAKLEQKSLRPATLADKTTLLRRATFDLIGLPPTPQEMADFLADRSPDAYAKVIDRLLASPRYGERWGRHWLDVARYADSTGADEDIKYPYAHRYRDYVIEAINSDLPYHQFIREQLAGDLLPAAKPGEVNRRGIIATGFLQIGLKLLAEQDKPKMVYDMVDEQLDTTTKAFLGLTVACARCHDHKFDPIPTKDYYSLAGIFASTKSLAKVEGTVSQIYFAPLVPKDEYARYEAHQSKIRAREKEIQAVVAGEELQYQNTLRPRLTDYMMAVYDYDHRPRAQEHTRLEEFGAARQLDALSLRRWHEMLQPTDDARPHLDRWFGAAAKGRAAAVEASREYQKEFDAAAAEWEPKLNDWRKQVADSVVASKDPPDRPGFQGGKNRFFAAVNFDARGPLALPRVPGSSHNPLFAKESNDRIAAIEAQIAELKKAAPPEPEMACGVTEGPPVEQRVFIRGNVAAPGEIAPKQFLRIIAGDNQKPVTSGSGRLELANWIADPNHPLTARVMVNRIWQYHFGEGLVRTPNNFGKLGETPSHPELLDYLAKRFIESGWSIKAMHRRIMLSAAYQMSGDTEKEAAEADPGNRLLSHFSRRRLDVEEIRDGLLALDGSLDLTMGGTLQSGFGTDGENSDARLSINPDTSKRRTVYLPIRRSNLSSLFNLFDFGDATTPGEGRARTNVAPQALFMMNGNFIAQRSQEMARKLLADQTRDDRARIALAIETILSRKAGDEEVRDLAVYVEAFQEKASKAKQKLDDPKLAAWQSLCRVLMSSNDFIYVD